MADVDLRRLEREAAQGDPSARERLLRERLKRGLIDDDRLTLAAYLDDPAARALRPHVAATPTGPFGEGLARWGRWVVVQATAALAQQAVPDESPSPAVVLRILGGAECALTPGANSVSIGRDPANRLQLTSAGASRRHCRIGMFEDGRLWAQDQGSSNGTWLGSDPLQGVVGIDPGMRLVMGQDVVEVCRPPPPGLLRDALAALTKWLAADPPTEQLWDEVVHWERALAEDGTQPREIRELVLAGLRATLTDPPSLPDAAAGSGATIRCALLPLALGPDPLPRVDPPARLARPAEHIPQWRERTIAVADELGLRLERPLRSRHGPVSVAMARAPNGARSRLVLVLDSPEPEDDYPDLTSERASHLEARELSRCAHPGLPRFVRLCTWKAPVLGPVVCLEVEHVDGDPLQPGSPAEAVRAVAALCPAATVAAEALAAEVPPLPQHVLATAQGPVLLAFQAFLTDSKDNEPHLSWGFMTPEGLEEELADLLSGDPGRRTVYRLGALLYWYLADRAPFVALRFNSLLRAIDRGTPDPVADVSSQLQAVLARALAREPADRYSDPLAFAEALGETPEGRG